MKPNPGGILKGEAIIDRDQEISSIWRALQNQSVVISSERRVGKTCILRKMEEHPQDDWFPVLYWVEGKEHPIEFVEGLYETFIEKNLIQDKFHNLKKFYTKFVGGENIGSWKFPQIKENWKTLLESMLEDIVASGKKVLVMLDELPLMLSKFIKADEIGPLGTMGFMDTLRGLRNKYESSKQIAFIFCGSIGIHLVIRDLKKNHGYNSDPINNMKLISVSGMEKEGALELCRRLAEEESQRFQPQDKLFDYICRQTDRLPFYIQHIFDYLYETEQKTITRSDIDQALDYLLNDPKDEGFFRHYLDRIKTYYDEKSQTIALMVLDGLCREKGYVEEGEIMNRVKTRLQETGSIEVDDESVKETLDLTWSDHYLIRQIKNQRREYTFRYDILKKWWRINRG